MARRSSNYPSELRARAVRIDAESPRPRDRAAMSAAQAWRYTAPGAGAHGAFVPENRHILAWIYGQPRTPIPGFNGWSPGCLDGTLPLTDVI